MHTFKAIVNLYILNIVRATFFGFTGLHRRQHEKRQDLWTYQSHIFDIIYSSTVHLFSYVFFLLFCFYFCFLFNFRSTLCWSGVLSIILTILRQVWTASYSRLIIFTILLDLPYLKFLLLLAILYLRIVLYSC